MTTQTGRAFNDWLRMELKARRMSQRQLAQRSGVAHSTISRIVQHGRVPSMDTATKLARGLRALGADADTPDAVRAVAIGTAHPTARVEYALRADEWWARPRRAKSWSTTWRFGPGGLGRLGAVQRPTIHRAALTCESIRQGRDANPGGAARVPRPPFVMESWPGWDA
jgi:transcriptional regulator with XRE-family HTH domain